MSLAVFSIAKRHLFFQKSLFKLNHLIPSGSWFSTNHYESPMNNKKILSNANAAHLDLVDQKSTGATITHESYAWPEPGPNDKIIVAMSSGVDSSTAAALLANKYPGQVSGVYMCNWSSYAKCSESEWNEVQEVCKHIDIKCQRVNFESDYWIDVFEPMLQMYKEGKTPNPDVNCNRYIKFGRLYEYVENSCRGGANWWLATGHYAKVGIHKATNIAHLLRPLDKKKDQTYYLSTIIPSKLSNILFPLGDYEKSTVRKVAKQLKIPTANKPDSQGLCFVSQEHNNFKNFLQDYVEPTPGNIVTEEGSVVGHHQGLWQATIGQRSGVSMPQGNPKYHGIWYVSDKRYDKNELVIVRGRDNPSLLSKGVICNDFHFLGSDIDISSNIDAQELTFQYRSLQEPQRLQHIDVKPNLGISPLSNCLHVIFAETQTAVSPGQYLVLYQGERVLGSGSIDQRLR